MGASVVVLAPTMWQSTVFSVLGWSLVVSSIALMLLPWKLHHRLGEHVLLKLVRHIKLFAVSVMAFGALLLFALSTTQVGGIEVDYSKGVASAPAECKAIQCVVALMIGAAIT